MPISSNDCQNFQLLQKQYGGGAGLYWTTGSDLKRRLRGVPSHKLRHCNMRTCMTLLPCTHPRTSSIQSCPLKIQAPQIRPELLNTPSWHQKDRQTRICHVGTIMWYRHGLFKLMMRIMCKGTVSFKKRSKTNKHQGIRKTGMLHVSIVQASQVCVHV